MRKTYTFTMTAQLEFGRSIDAETLEQARELMIERINARDPELIDSIYDAVNNGNGFDTIRLTGEVFEYPGEKERSVYAYQSINGPF